MKIFKTLLFLAVFLDAVVDNAQISVQAYVSHINPNGYDSVGNITLNVSGGTSPYTYNWTPGNITSNNLSNVKKNLYTVKVKGHNHDSATCKYNIGYKALWASFSGAAQQHDTLLNTRLYSNWGTALSKNTWPARTDGWFEVVLSKSVTAQPTAQQIGVLDSAFSQTNFCTDIDFGININPTSINLFINSVLSLTITYRPGDVFRLERTVNSVTYKLRDSIIFKTSYAAQQNWKLRAGVYGKSIPIVNVGCSFNQLGNTYFANYIKLSPVIIPCSGKDSTNGSIGVTPNESVTVTYTWQPGNVISPVITSGGISSYNVLAQDYLNNTSYYNFSIGFKSQWTNFSGAVQQHDSLINTGLYTWGSAISKNTLQPNKDGWLQVVLTSGNTYEHVGFLDSAFSINDNRDIKMGFYKYPHSIQRLISGTYTYLADWREGDILRIERKGNTINYKLNGNIIWTNTDASYNQKKWKIKASVFSSGGPVTNIGSSFNSLLDGVASKEHADYAYPYNGSAFIALSGGIPPYKVLWKDSLSSNYRDNMAPGIYQVLISDSASVDTLSKNIAIGVKPNWRFNTNVSFSPDTAKRTRSDSLGLSISDNSITNSQQGWVEIKINSLSDDLALGFVGDNADISTQTPDYIASFQSANTALSYSLMSQAVNNTLSYTAHSLNLNPSYDKINIIRLRNGVITLLFRGSSDLNTYSYAVNDIIKIGRNEMGNIYIAKNDVILYTHTAIINNQFLYPNLVLNSNPVTRSIGVIPNIIINPAAVLPNVYAVPKIKLDGGYYTATSNYVFFTVEGEYNTMSLKFNVYNKSNTVVLSNASPNLTSLINTSIHALGDNRYKLNVSSLAPGYYILEIINEKKEKLYLRFKDVSSGIVVNPKSIPPIFNSQN